MTADAWSWFREPTLVVPLEGRAPGMRERQIERQINMRRMALLLSGFLLLLAACGNDDKTVAPTDDAVGSGEQGGDDPSAEGGGVESDADGTLWGVTNTLFLLGVDLSTGEEVDSSSPEQIVEPLTPQLVDTLEFTAGVSALAADDGKVYIAHSGAGSLVVERFDAETLASEAKARVLEDNPSHTVEALVPDGDTLWVLQGNGFALHKVDAATLKVQETVRLGRFQGGQFGDLYGYGTMVQVGDVLWVVDDYNKELLRIDKSDLKPEVIGSIDEYLLGRMQLSANSDSIFLATGDDSAGRLVRFDGDTGEHVDTYELGPDGARAFSVDDDHLYVNDDYLGDLVESWSG